MREGVLDRAPTVKLEDAIVQLHGLMSAAHRKMLAFIGDRSTIYQHPPAPMVLVHDWLWHRRGTGLVVSLPLLKRLNLVKQ